MTTLVYVQPNNTHRVLTAADLGKYDVEDFKKTTFTKGEPVDVDDAAAELLLSHPDFEGEFVEVTDSEDEDDSDSDEPAKATKKAAKKAAKKGADTGDADSAGASSDTSGSTGRGTSTGGSAGAGTTTTGSTSTAGSTT